MTVSGVQSELRGKAAARPMCVAGCGLLASSPDDRFCWIHFFHQLSGRCIVSGCDDGVRSHGFCHKHYMQRLRVRHPAPDVKLSDFLDRAACQGMGPEHFFGDEPSETAREACSRCSVADQCRAWATAKGEYGFWGGTTRGERMRDAGLPRPKARYSSDATCDVDGCERRPTGRGRCHKHLMQLYRKGEAVSV